MADLSGGANAAPRKPEDVFDLIARLGNFGNRERADMSQHAPAAPAKFAPRSLAGIDVSKLDYGSPVPFRNYNFDRLTPEEAASRQQALDASPLGWIGQQLAKVGDTPAQYVGPGLLGMGPPQGSQRPTTIGDIASLFAPPSRPEQFDNPLVALGPEGNFAGNVGEALAPIARTLTNKVLAGAEGLTKGRLPQFATEAAGSGRLDLGATGGGPQTNLERMLAEGGDFSKVSKADRAAEQAAANSGVVTKTQAETNNLLKRGIATREAPNLMADAETGFLGQRRGVRSHADTEVAAQEMVKAGLSADEIVRLGEAGTAVNAETLIAANHVADGAAEQFIKAVNGEGDAVTSLVNTLKVQKAVRGFIAEGGRVTEANKLIKTEIADRAAADGDTARQLIQAARGLENPDNIKAIVSLAKGMDFSNRAEARRLLNVVLDLGETEAKAKLPPQTMADKILSVANLPKTIMSSLDLSAPFRQGVVLSAAHPIVAGRATVMMLKAAASRNFAKNAMREIMTSPLAPLRRKAGLYLSDVETAVLKDREEAFMSNLANKIPGVSGSNRAYSMYLNKLRADVFDQVASTWGPTKSDAEYHALAQFINWSTGRGDLGPFNSSAPLLNNLFFSPRLVVSRVQTPLAPFLFAAQGNTAAARVAAGDLVKFVGAGLSVLTLAQMGGASVEIDPRSSKFGKMQIGPHQIDIWGGFQPVARYAAQFITGERKTADGEIIVTDGTGPFGDTRWDTLDRFRRSKAGPAAGLVEDALRGEDFLGNKFDLSSELLSRLLPLGAQQIYEAVEADRQNAMRGAIVGTLGMVGLGTVSIDDGTNEPLIQNPFNPRNPVDIEQARLGVAAPKLEGVALNSDQQRVYSRYVEDARHNALGALLTDPTYMAASNTEKRDIWDRTSRQAAESGKKAFGIDLATNGKNQEEIVAGTLTAIRSSQNNYSRAEAASLLDRVGTLTPEIKQAVDARRTQADPSKPNYELSVDEYLHGKELVDAWRKAPAFTIGDPMVWSAAQRAREQLVELRRGKTAEEIKNSAQIQIFYATAAGGWLKTLYSSDGSRNEKYIGAVRAMIAKDRVWSRFSDAVSGEP